MSLVTKKMFQGFTKLMLLALVNLLMVAQAEPPLDIATMPLANSGTKTIRPNLLFIFDDSGSMGWEYMPDWASAGGSLRQDASYNTLAYNPRTRYLPPDNFTNAGFNNAIYPSQTGDPRKASSGAAGGSKQNWRSVKVDAYKNGRLRKDLQALNGGLGPQFWVSIPTEYCEKADLKRCRMQKVSSARYSFPAPLRWCSTAKNADPVTTPNPSAGACQATRLRGTFQHLRLPAFAPPPGTPVATIKFTFIRSSPRVSVLTVGGQSILGGPTARTNSRSALATQTKNQINRCTRVRVGGCTVSGFSARVSGRNTVTIYSPYATAARPDIRYQYGSLRVVRSNFAVSRVIVGRVMTTISTSAGNRQQYPYPGSSTKAEERTDCRGQVCTYAEEMTNYANWYAYYRTRSAMMKTATSRAFKDLDDEYRVGFMAVSTIGHRSLNIKRFTLKNKAAWYAKLFATVHNGSTPLRGALSTAGRIFAGKTSGRGAFTDPVQYACQQNFALLTTDGVWTTRDSAGGPLGLDGKNVGNRDRSTQKLPVPRGIREGTTAAVNTLADVAKYYHDTDLRTPALRNCTGASGGGVCETPSATGSSSDKAQTMTTLTLGLGVDGTLAYIPDYKTEPGDFQDIKLGHKDWPNPITNPTLLSEARTDDLWHAAVNGGGTYFSAKNPDQVVAQLQAAIASITVKAGAGAAVATSTLNPVSVTDFAYVAGYTSGLWTGNLEKRGIDLATGEVKRASLACVEDVVPEGNCSSPSSIVPDGSGGYSCVTTGITAPSSCTGTVVGAECHVAMLPSCHSSLKKQLVKGKRIIYASNGVKLVPFTFANLVGAQASNFAPAFLRSQLTQGSSYTPAQKGKLTGDNLVNYLKGDGTYEQGKNKLFRKRTAILGDVIDSTPTFIGQPTFNYDDSGYQDFKAANLSRAGTVYVGANDGMLHAFDADTLTERWAFVPSAVIPNLWKLADTNYSAKHSYYVNGDVTVSDICVATDCTKASASDWRTILIGGLDGGGRGYYALDITNPKSRPKLLWEIDPADKGFNHLGYTYGNPIVTKRAGDKKWVVAFTSGYNNIPDNDAFYTSSASTGFQPNLTPQFVTGDGKGYLFVVDAASGSRLSAISTRFGRKASPSGLGKISAYAEFAEKNNETTYIYGGDLDGNLWRFNIHSGTNSVLHFAQLKDENDKAQPIMTRPVLAKIRNKRVVFVGTGKYLEVTDLDATSFSPQSLYALKDAANDGDPGPTFSNPRSVKGIVAQTVKVSATSTNKDERVSGTSNKVNFARDLGWYLDFPDGGERQNVASQLVLGTLLVPTTVPTASACQPAGYGWFNSIDYETGLAVPNASGAVSQRTSSPIVGFNTLSINGQPKVSVVQADNSNPKLLEGVSFDNSGSGFRMKRSIWHEIIADF